VCSLDVGSCTCGSWLVVAMEEWRKRKSEGGVNIDFELNYWWDLGQTNDQLCMTCRKYPQLLLGQILG
jgi:hypothetical protein